MDDEVMRTIRSSVESCADSTARAMSAMVNYIERMRNLRGDALKERERIVAGVEPLAPRLGYISRDEVLRIVWGGK